MKLGSALTKQIRTRKYQTLGKDTATTTPDVRVPAWRKKTAVMWHSLEDKARENYITDLNNKNWRDGKEDVEVDEKCYKQKPIGIPGFFMGDKIWPISMLHRSVIHLTIYLKKITLVSIPGSDQASIAEEVKNQCLVPMAYWNPKTIVRPFTVPGYDDNVPTNLRPYWVLEFVNGHRSIVQFREDAENKYEVISDLQEELQELDSQIDHKQWLPVVSNCPDQNGWIRVKTHGLDDYTIHQHCPLQHI